MGPGYKWCSERKPTSPIKPPMPLVYDFPYVRRLNSLFVAMGKRHVTAGIVGFF